MILTRKCLLVEIFLIRSLSKSLAFCEFASVNFEPCLLVVVNILSVGLRFNLRNTCTSLNVL